LQARVAGAQRVVLKVGNDGDGLEKVVGGAPGVLRVSALGVGGVEFETAPGQDARPGVARAVVQAGYDLLEMHPIGVSLEDIFLELTRDEPEPPQTWDGEAEPLQDDTRDGEEA
jgi:ABC-2 type transport system ATP-binding protein